MIGRAAQGQLWLPGAIAAALKAGTTCHTIPSTVWQLALQRRHLESLHEFHGEYLGHRIARKHYAWFLDSLVAQHELTQDDSRQHRQQFNALSTPQHQLAHLDQLAKYLALPDERLLPLQSLNTRPGAQLAA